MRVGIDKTRHDYAMTGIDDLGIAANKDLYVTPAANGFDVLATHEDRAVFNNGELAQVTARARPARARKGDYL